MREGARESGRARARERERKRETKREREREREREIIRNEFPVPFSLTSGVNPLALCLCFSLPFVHACMWENDWLEYLCIAVRVVLCICASVQRCGSGSKSVLSSDLMKCTGTPCILLLIWHACILSYHHACTVCMRVCCLPCVCVCMCVKRCKAESADAFSRSCPLPLCLPPHSHPSPSPIPLLSRPSRFLFPTLLSPFPFANI